MYLHIHKDSLFRTHTSHFTLTCAYLVPASPPPVADWLLARLTGHGWVKPDCLRLYPALVPGQTHECWLHASQLSIEDKQGFMINFMIQHDWGHMHGYQT